MKEIKIYSFKMYQKNKNISIHYKIPAQNGIIYLKKQC